MKELSKYQCEYCKTEYKDKYDCVECETNHKIIKQAVVNVEIEGEKIDDDIKAKVKKLLEREITYEEYLDYIKRKHKLPTYDRP